MAQAHRPLAQKLEPLRLREQEIKPGLRLDLEQAGRQLKPLLITLYDLLLKAGLMQVLASLALSEPGCRLVLIWEPDNQLAVYSALAYLVGT